MATAALGSQHLEATDGSTGAPPQKSSMRPLFFAVAVAFAIRLIIVAIVFRSLPDPSRHFEAFGNEVGWIARSLAQHQGFSSPFYPASGPTALLPPLYPFLLAAIFKLFGIYSTKSALTILTLNSAFSALTCIPIFLATRISVNARAAAFAAWGWAIYPFAIYYSAVRVWEFSLTSLLITTCFWLALQLHEHPTPLRWIGFGVLFGIAALSNPAVSTFFPVLLLLPLWKLYRAGGSWLRAGLFAAVGIVAALTPWTIRNYRVMHVVVPVRDCFWYEFWSANNGDGSNPTLEWTHPASNPVEMDLYRSQGELAYIAQKRVMVIDYVAHHHDFFIALTLRRIFCYWTGFWSFEPSYMRQEPTQLPNIFMCTSLTLLLLFGARGWWRRDRIACLAYLVPLALFPIAYYLSHPLMDYRQPIEPEVVILVVLGLRELKWRIQARSTASDLDLNGVTLDVPSPSFAEMQTSGPLVEAAPTAG
ncbi:MAG: glycosyltransferase family 39 protein [Acidobacteriota bacterium]|nr:glycosyltransferase family 39 protein [Acidobacteriota bacterium]